MAHSRDDERNIFKILFTSDIHLGYNLDKRRGTPTPDDSFVTFEEILECGKREEVDFILLGGNLFHDAKPTISDQLKCMELIRKHCLGSGEIRITCLADVQAVFQHCAFKTINYEDPNFNVAMPIFSIHGNHDAPSCGTNGPMDLLSATGLVNYFGKFTGTKVKVCPVILKKGKTVIAIYGLSYIPDDKLRQMLEDSKVSFSAPNEIQNVFHVLLLHQKRSAHLKCGHTSELKFPEFINLVIWGHEHACRVEAEYIPEKQYFVSQPGSTIATSLCKDEAKTKHIGLLYINSKKMLKVEKIKLKTVRPFVFGSLNLDEQNIQEDHGSSLSNSVFNFVDKRIENKLIPKAALQLTNHPKQPTMPLILLEIIYSKDEQVFDKMKLVQKYCEEVANPYELVRFRKKRTGKKSSRFNFDDMSDEVRNMAEILDYTEENQGRGESINEYIERYFSTDENKNLLSLVPVDRLNEALTKYIETHDENVFKNLFSCYVKKAASHLEASAAPGTVEGLRKELEKYSNKMKEKAQEVAVEVVEIVEEEEEQSEVCSNVKKAASYLEASAAPATVEGLRKELESYSNKMKEKAQEVAVEVVEEEQSELRKLLLAANPTQSSNNDNIIDIIEISDDEDEAEKTDKVPPKTRSAIGITAAGSGTRNRSKKTDKNKEVRESFVDVATASTSTNSRKKGQKNIKTADGYILTKINRTKPRPQFIEDSDTD